MVYSIDQIKVFKGTVLNLALESLHGGSIEITPTVPLRMIFLIAYRLGLDF